jgi:hypothetical protein
VKATTPQAARLRRVLDEVGRAPLVLSLLLPVVPEGPELLPVLVPLRDPERELLEPPEVLVLAGGARERGGGRSVT